MTLNKLLALIISFCLLSCVTTNDVKVERVAFDFLENHIYLDVRNNKQTHNFIFDTGADICFIDPEFSDGQELSGEIELSQNEVSLPYYNTGFILGDYRLNNVLTAIYDFSELSKVAEREVPGILGRSFFSNFAFSIDYKNSEMLLGESVGEIISEMDNDDFKNLTLFKNSTDILIQVEANGRIYPAKIDTGADYSLIPRKLLEEIRINDPALVKDTLIVKELTSLFIGSLRNISDREAYVLLSEFKMSDMTFNDLLFKSWDQEYFLLGNDFLKHFTWIFDYYNRIFLVKPEFNPDSRYSLDLPILYDLNFYCHEDGKLVVKEVVEGSDPWVLGVRPNMVVTSINEHSTVVEKSRDDIWKIVYDNIDKLENIEVVNEEGTHKLYQF